MILYYKKIILYTFIEPWQIQNLAMDTMDIKGAFYVEDFLFPLQRHHRVCIFFYLNLTLRKYNIEMIMNQSMLTRRHFFILASDNQNDVEMQNKINDRNRAREERHKQHIARNEGNYKVIFRIAK